MTITHGTNLLASDALFFGPYDLQASAQLRAQIARMLRADTARLRVKGSARNEITFSVDRRHETVSEAEAFFLTHAQDVSGLADAAIVCGQPGDQETLEMQDASLSAAAQSRSGLRTTHRYTISAGAISSS